MYTQACVSKNLKLSWSKNLSKPHNLYYKYSLFTWSNSERRYSSNEKVGIQILKHRSKKKSLQQNVAKYRKIRFLCLKCYISEIVLRNRDTEEWSFFKTDKMKLTSVLPKEIVFWQCYMIFHYTDISQIPMGFWYHFGSNTYATWQDTVLSKAPTKTI